MPNELLQLDIYNLFEKASRKFYKKKGRFLYRKAVNEETILTIVSGHLETLKKAALGDVIIRNIEIGSSAETYIISGEKFVNRYDPLEIRHIIDGQEWFEALAKGRCEAYEYSGEEIRFKAPWGEPMICVTGDFMARPVPGDAHDIYRIERQTFLQTYEQE